MSRRLGVGARRIRKFGDVAAVVAKRAGLGDVSRDVKKNADKLADMMEKIKDETE